MRSAQHDVGAAMLLVLGSVHGLVREQKSVRKALDAFRPEAVALPVGPRELKEIRLTLKDKDAGRERKREVGKRAVLGKVGPTGIGDRKVDVDDVEEESEDFGLFVSNSDMVYLRRLAKFGDVEMPPPSYQEAVRWAKANGAKARGVDLDDEQYTEVFVAHISLFRLMRQGRRVTRLAKKEIAAPDAEAFALEWDRLENGGKGYREVQLAREAKMAEGIRALCGKYGRVAAVIEVERMEGVLGCLREGGGEP